MKVIKLFVLTLIIGLAISSCGEDNVMDQQLTGSELCTQKGNAWLAAVANFDLDPTETTCFERESTYLSFINSCAATILISSGDISQEDYDELVEKINDLDCNTL